MLLGYYWAAISVVSIFLCIHCNDCKTKITKNFVDFMKKNFVEFQNLQKSNFVTGKFLKIRSSRNHSWGRVRSHKKIWAQSVQQVLEFIGHKQTSKVTLKMKYA